MIYLKAQTIDESRKHKKLNIEKQDFVNTITYRILYRRIKMERIMKVTAIIDDKIIKDAMKYSKASTVTGTLKIALNEYVRIQKLRDLGKVVKSKPMEFNYSADEIRNLNREV
jgi:hypothetical protein